MNFGKVSTDLVKLPPAQKCLICSRTLRTRKHDRRITAVQELGVRVRESAQSVIPGRCMITARLPDGRTVCVEYWGSDGQWTPAILERARILVEDGQHPWFCASCAGRVCPVCQAPLLYPVGSDVIHENGEILHVPIWPFRVGCSRRTCPNQGIHSGER